MIRQADLSGFAEGSLPPRGGDVDDEGEELPVHTWGRRCAKCGRRLGGGGLKVLGWPGLLCWNCYHSTTSIRAEGGEGAPGASRYHVRGRDHRVLRGGFNCPD